MEDNFKHKHEHHHDHECECCHDHHDHDHNHECECCHEHAHVHHIHQEPSFTYKVVGLDCPSCAQGACDTLLTLDCVSDASLIYATGKLDVVKKDDKSETHTKQHVLDTLRDMGYDVELNKSDEDTLDTHQSFWKKNRQKILLGVSGVGIVIGAMLEHSSNISYTYIYTLSALAGLIYLAPNCISSLKRKKLDMNVLMSIAVIGALIMGWTEDVTTLRDGAIVIFLDQIGEWLEGWSMRKTTNSIESLKSLTSDTVHLVHGDHVHETKTDNVEVGQIIRVLPGEYIALDAVVVSGTTSVNEAAVTGESLDKEKGVGDTVYAGTLNGSGVVELEVVATSDNSQIARIIKQVHDSQEYAAPYQSFVDRFASVYTPIVVVSALIVGIVVPLVVSMFTPLTASDWVDWAYKALSLLVVACPCALVISTPVSFVSAITAAAKHGVLVRGGVAIDSATKVDSVVFDKTGTLTTGNLHVEDIYVEPNMKFSDVFSIASAVEQNSTHPIANCITKYSVAKNIKPIALDDLHETPGFGLEGVSGSDTYKVGKLSYVCSTPTIAQMDMIKSFTSRAMSVVGVSKNNKLVGIIGVSDTIKPGAEHIKQDLIEEGIDTCVMLTGDCQAAADKVASECGITTYKAELLPEEKTSYIQSMIDNNKNVVMVGDGINDAPSLALANLSVAQGTGASDTALELADVAFLNDDITNLTKFIKLSKHTMKVVKQNIAFAIGVKLLIFILVIVGIAGMGAAVFADTGVALLVILNGMRLMLDKSFR